MPGSLVKSQNSKDLKPGSSVSIYAASYTLVRNAALSMAAVNGKKQLIISAEPENQVLDLFSGEAQPVSNGLVIKTCPTDTRNAAVLRTLLDYLRPQPLGLVTSAGMGDRLGLATPGHVQAMKHVLSEYPEHPIAPIFSQQSIREMTRTHRNPADVLRDATWGAFQAGWKTKLGADADHLKTPDDIDRCAAEGYSFFTFDPGAYVDITAGELTRSELKSKLDLLPWGELQTTDLGMEKQYCCRAFDLGDRKLTLEPEEVMRAAVKYGQAIAHIVRMYNHLQSKGIPNEVEISVDETDSPTSLIEHLIIAGELKRLGVHWVSLAPRYSGRFEKGVDYIGDLQVLNAEFEGHAAIARTFGPYKLSLHSGSDKFSVYPLAVKATQGMVHLKTAGTSYLEGLRTIASVQPDLFREILALGIERYSTDRATYHVSAELNKVTAPESIGDGDLPGVLDQFDTREVLHVTFGSALDQYGELIISALNTHEFAYYSVLEKHFLRHLNPFAMI